MEISNKEILNLLSRAEGYAKLLVAFPEHSFWNVIDGDTNITIKYYADGLVREHAVDPVVLTGRPDNTVDRAALRARLIGDIDLMKLVKHIFIGDD